MALFVIGLLQISCKQSSDRKNETSRLASLLLFCYSCFLKPHSAGKIATGTQQDFLEAFYSSQVGIYDDTRKTLLKGREDMLALVAAQLRLKAEKGNRASRKNPVWVDVSSLPF